MTRPLCDTSSMSPVIIGNHWSPVIIGRSANHICYSLFQSYDNKIRDSNKCKQDPGLYAKPARISDSRVEEAASEGCAPEHRLSEHPKDALPRIRDAGANPRGHYNPPSLVPYPLSLSLPGRNAKMSYST